MNKNVSVGVRGGKPAKGVSPQATARIGIQTITSTGVAKMPGPISKPLGNELTTNVGKGGPGVGRTVHPTGSQSAAPKASSTTTQAGWPWTKRD
ncbi:hypothetical protein ACMA5K_01425 [Bradyrhizobium diazoefficiens]|uniref:hypothetical protein n=1 Tax=Bradyrhizobium diazoefficiens TaxID=1355477 RepID=UPI000BEC6213|nr:hypothetical protein [Bradyrhizobium diazoefficiens]PDT62577.1 hypothetical protein CO678_09065 [Bradyrhizobium diazoefficiens]QLD39779.1 hypothetical protein HUW42_01415 [Bradyrhizobium diazoefficiens]